MRNFARQFTLALLYVAAGAALYHYGQHCGVKRDGMWKLLYDAEHRNNIRLMEVIRKRGSHGQTAR